MNGHSSHLNLMPLLLPIGALLAFLGYTGPWVDHDVAGLAILGLDLGEYVKFLPQVRTGTTSLWREGFYLPLVSISLALSLCTWRAEWSRLSIRPRADWSVATWRMLNWTLIAFQVIGAIVAALNLLPPAWTPQRLLTPEFQQQTAALVLCLGAVGLGPFLALLPQQVTGSVILLLCAAAVIVPVVQFLAVLPEIAMLYNHSLVPGWGMYLMIGGLALLVVLGGLLAFGRPGHKAW